MNRFSHDKIPILGLILLGNFQPEVGNVVMVPGLCSITRRFVPGYGSVKIGWSKIMFVKATSTLYAAVADGALDGNTWFRYAPTTCGWLSP